jgi:hypothetical protein
MASPEKSLDPAGELFSNRPAKRQPQPAVTRMAEQGKPEMIAWFFNQLFVILVYS